MDDADFFLELLDGLFNTGSKTADARILLLGNGF
jgi:hypothetical protein